MMPHRALANLVRSYHRMDISCERVAQFTSMSFDVSFLEIFFTITQGGELHVVPERLKGQLQGLREVIHQNNIGTLFLPTSFFHFIGAQKLLGKLTTVRHIIVAGEQLQLAENVKTDLESIGATLHNHYGPTEAQVVTPRKVRCQIQGSIS